MGRQGEGSAPAFIDQGEFEQKLAFLKQSGIKDLRLIGGEPSLHPQFCELIERGLEQGFNILVFTHGLLSEAVCHFLEGLTESECTLCINMNSQHRHPTDHHLLHEKRLSVIRRLPRLAVPGFNIYTPEFDLSPLFDTIEATGCRRVIRLGLAHPTLQGSNVFLHPKHYRFVGKQIATYVPRALACGVHFEFDCGFVRCMFTEEEIENLQQTGTQPRFKCSPILDMDINRDVLYCFSLGDRYKIDLDMQESASEMREKLSEEAQPYRTSGVYPACADCVHKQEGECPGGCLAVTMRRYHVSRFDAYQEKVSSPLERKNDEKPIILTKF